MSGVVYHFMAIVLAIVLVAIGLMICIGLLSMSTIHIGYHENESDIYLSHIQDMSHGLRHKLAGIHCFQPLPSWAYTDPMEGSPDFGRDFVRRSEQIDELIELVNCKYPNTFQLNSS